jgi:NAD(P)-dependent dehydrogenase (short-subunit alcohol dehydrogenase family)
MKLQGKVAVVTGGAQGIGRALAARFIQEGASVAIADIRGAAETAAALRNPGTQALGVPTDVTSERDVARMVDEVRGTLGGIDILVNNAAFFSAIEPRSFEAIAPDEWRQVMEVNTLGVFLACRACVPEMKRRGGGRIINLASGAPLKGIPFMLHYVTSKGAVIALTRALARELGPHNITVNALAPGLTLSAGVLANPVHVEKFGEVVVRSRAIQRDEYPEDVAGAAAFLASSDAAFMTGQTVVVDGGSVFV